MTRFFTIILLLLAVFQAKSANLVIEVRDSQTKKSYGNNILGVKTAINEMLISFNHYEINVTFAIVGFLFLKNKDEILSRIPKILPNYKNKNLSRIRRFNRRGAIQLKAKFA
jgi:hypothetical protein